MTGSQAQGVGVVLKGTQEVAQLVGFHSLNLVVVDGGVAVQNHSCLSSVPCGGADVFTMEGKQINFKNYITQTLHLEYIYPPSNVDIISSLYKRFL